MPETIKTEDKNISKTLEDWCYKLDINMTDLCKRTEVNRAKPSLWKDKEPYTFVDVRKLIGGLREVAQEKGIEMPDKILL